MIALSCSVPTTVRGMETVFVGNVFATPAGAHTTAQSLCASTIAQETDTVLLASANASRASLEIHAVSQFALIVALITENAKLGAVSVLRDMPSACWRTVLRSLAHDVLRVNAKMDSASAEADGEERPVTSRHVPTTVLPTVAARRVVFVSVTTDGAKTIAVPRFAPRDSTRPECLPSARATVFAMRNPIACATVVSWELIALRKCVLTTAQTVVSASLVAATAPTGTLDMTAPRTHA